MIKEVVINPRRKVRCDLDPRSIIKVGQDSSMLSKIYDVNGPNQKDFAKPNRESNSPYLPKYKKSHRSLSLKEKRVVHPEANKSHILTIQEKIFADLQNFENSLQLESGRSSQASVVQKSLDDKSFSGGIRKFDNLPFAKDLDLFRQKFKKMFPNQTEQSPVKRDQGQEYKLKHGKVSLQIKQRAQSIYMGNNNTKASLILKQFQNATKQSQDQFSTTTSKRSFLNKSHSGAQRKTRKDLNQSFGSVYHHHNNSFQKNLHDRNQSFDYPSKNTKTDISMDDGEYNQKHRLLKLQQDIPMINLNRLKNLKANSSHSNSNNSKERIAKSLKQKHSDLELAPMIFSSVEKEDQFKVAKKHNRSLIMPEDETKKLKNPKFEYDDLINQILAANEKPKPSDSELLKIDNPRKQWMKAFEDKKARLMNIYINGRQHKTQEKLQTEPDSHYKTIDPSLYIASKNPSSSVFEINQQQSDFQALPLGTSTSWIKNIPLDIQKKHNFLGKSIPKRKVIPK